MIADTEQRSVAQSTDPRVHVGSDGWLFDIGADVSLIDLYKPDSVFTDEQARAWVERLRERHDRLQARGVEYVHISIPDKLTLLSQQHGGLENPAGSPILQLVERYDWDTPSFLNIVPYLAAQVDKYPIYWKSANHWSSWGCFLAYQMLCSRLKIPTNTNLLNYPFEEREQVLELGALVSPSPLETIREYRFDKYSERVYANRAVRLLEQRGHSAQFEDVAGCNVIYRNESPDAYDGTLVLFGSRFSGFRNHLLTGMLAETIREVHFIGSEDIDDEYLRRLRPDFVVTEIPEARMLSLPSDTMELSVLASQRMAALEADVPVVETSQTIDPDCWQTQRLLESETYHLDAPVMVQDGCDASFVDQHMHSQPVDMHTLRGGRVYLRGDRCLVQSRDRRDVLRYGVDAATEHRIADENHRRLRGKTLLLAPSAGTHCYYHWMLDILPLLGLLERAGTALGHIDHFLVRQITGQFQRETLSRFGIREDRIVETLNDQYLECDELYYISLDNGINMTMNRFVPLWLKHNFQRAPDSDERIRLYISRPPGVRRGISNEEELRPVLEEAGFVMTAMEGKSVSEQAELLARADLLVSPHGGALTNMVFCRPGIQVVEILSRHVYPYYNGLAQMCGHRYHALLENPEEDYGRLVSQRMARRYADASIQHQTHEQSFELDPALLARMLQVL